MIYIGIDPGKDGAMAVIDTDQDSVVIYHWDDDYNSALNNYIDNKCVCYIERVRSQPNNGVKAAFTFGENYGYIRGLLESRSIGYQTVPPQTWKKEFSLDNDKKKSIECAKRLFPNVDLKRTERCKTDHDGKAEALLIAEYCRRHYK